ncbi:MAG: lysophospholipid acyltransferase family protein [Myxococcota bacterium]|nr:lysophospholipid acyltransferase family protein [Myxococcota bacterium]
MKLSILVFFASMLMHLLKLTWRVRLAGPTPNTEGPRIFCFWHGRQAGLFAYPRHRPVAVLSSLSKDGTLQARILERFGFVVLRGSTHRQGATGLRALISAMAQGMDAAFAVDGPRGPAFEVKSGAILAAQRTGATLVPITSRATAFWTIPGTWDDYRLPKPFSKVTLIHAAPMPVDGKDMQVLTRDLASQLRMLESASEEC